VSGRQAREAGEGGHLGWLGSFRRASRRALARAPRLARDLASSAHGDGRHNLVRLRAAHHCRTHSCMQELCDIYPRSARTGPLAATARAPRVWAAPATRAHQGNGAPSDMCIENR
jgi:hypothetical protein